MGIYSNLFLELEASLDLEVEQMEVKQISFMVSWIKNNIYNGTHLEGFQVKGRKDFECSPYKRILKRWIAFQYKPQRLVRLNVNVLGYGVYSARIFKFMRLVLFSLVPVKSRIRFRQFNRTSLKSNSGYLMTFDVGAVSWQSMIAIVVWPCLPRG
ncbi:hypothetical protein Tco_0781838 [Tanacetum coccineum]